jgi:uncharacterized protein YeaO (DUF488 family)
MIKVKRIYDAPAATDGRRVLVDRLWPRGVSKEKAKIDVWLKDVAPSDSLRRWFAHDPDKWPEFRKRYRDELESAAGRLTELRRLSKEGPVTLVFAAKDEKRNNAIVLKSILEGRR